MNFKENNEYIWLEDEAGERIAYVQFPEAPDGAVNLLHTVVSEKLRGQGVGGKLLDAFVEKLKREGKKTELTCSYAINWFEKHPEHKDLVLKINKGGSCSL